MSDERKKMSWEVTGSVLKGTFVSGLTVEVDLKVLFPMWDTFTDVQKAAVAYGVKQGMMDKTAKNSDEALTDQERKDVMLARWTMWTVENKWTSGTRGSGISFKVKQNTAWDNASYEEQLVLVKLNMAPAGKTAPDKEKPGKGKK